MLVVQNIHVRMNRSIGVCSYFSSSVPYVLSVLFGWFIYIYMQYIYIYIYIYICKTVLWWPIYTIMNSSSFMNTNPIYSQGDFLPAVNPDSFKWRLLPAVWTIFFCIYVLFIQYIGSAYFLCFCVFFLALNWLQQIVTPKNTTYIFYSDN